MVDYLNITNNKEDFLDIFHHRLRHAEDNSEILNSSALDIQRLYRGITDREKIVKKNYAANEIQRIFRGLVGRKLTKTKYNNKLDNKGYYSRKYKKDMKRRKDYCKYVVTKGEEVVNNMNKYQEEVAEREANEAGQGKDEMFKSLASNLHHLVSTRQIPGVYQPHREFNETPTMKGLPVEEHIRGVVKDLLRTRGITHRGLEVDVNGTLRIPLKNLKYRLSIQASAPYSAVQDEERRKKMLHRILTKPKGDWFAGGKTKLLDKNEDPLCKGDIYMDPWANPMLVKGVPQSQKQLQESARQHKPLFVRKLDKPYVTKVGGNRSSTLPNDVFDTIAEAQETGGAIQRHMGTKTSRFGLPESADARTGDAGTIPKAPLRVTRTLRTSRTTYGPEPTEPDPTRPGRKQFKSQSAKSGFSSKPSTGKHSRSGITDDKKLSAASRVGESGIDDLWGSSSTLVMGSAMSGNPTSAGGNQYNSGMSPNAKSSYVDDDSSDEEL